MLACAQSRQKLGRLTGGELKALIADALAEAAARFRAPIDLDSFSALLSANGGLDGLDPYYLGTLQLQHHSTVTAGAQPSLSLQIPSTAAAAAAAAGGRGLDSPAYSHPASLHLTSARTCRCSNQRIQYNADFLSAQ